VISFLVAMKAIEFLWGMFYGLVYNINPAFVCCADLSIQASSIDDI